MDIYFALLFTPAGWKLLKMAFAASVTGANNMSYFRSSVSIYLTDIVLLR